jgi:pimeloyl-ACP methyl ester carboxylesterase
MSPTRIKGPAGALSVDDAGRGGIPVVFLHSIAGNSAHWNAALEHVRKTRRAVAIDLRAHGHSDSPRNRDYSIAGMVSDVEALVDTLDLRKFVLVGHSMGGGVALTYAGERPDRIAGLLLLDPIGDSAQIPEAEVKAFLDGLESNYDSVIQNYWTQIAGSNSVVSRRLLADLRATPKEAVVQGLHSVMRFNPHPALASYGGPILSVVTPGNDQPFSLHRVGKGFSHRMVQGTGHWIQLDKPAEFNRILDEFLKTIKA